MSYSEKFPEDFRRIIITNLESGPLHCHHGMTEDDQGGIGIHAIDGSLTPDQIYDYFWKHVTLENQRHVILAMDRFTKPDQGTEFDDALTCLYWWHDPEINWCKTMKVGVVNYQVDPLIVREIDWNNEFWSEQMIKEANLRRPSFRINIEKKE